MSYSGFQEANLNDIFGNTRLLYAVRRTEMMRPAQRGALLPQIAQETTRND
jgi:hypothetical protein